MKNKKFINEIQQGIKDLVEFEQSELVGEIHVILEVDMSKFTESKDKLERECEEINRIITSN